jgi:ABC-type sugar transport system ATPase subunit
MNVRAVRIESAGVPPVAPLGGAGSRPHVTIRGLSKRFDNAVIYDNFDLDIPRGELISIFGPNGCGKSTLINMIAGLIPVDQGQILFDGVPLADIKFGYVFQNYREALFPWLRAFDNIAYPLKMSGCRARSAKPAPSGWSNTLASKSISICILIRCPAGNSSLSRSCARWWSSRRFCFSTSRSPRSTTK